MVATRQVGAVSTNGVVNPILVTVTPGMAAQWLEDWAYERQRNVSRKHVEKLAGEMMRGNFIPGTLIHIVVWNGKNNIIDGQHRLHAVIESGEPQVFSVLTTRVDSESRMSWMYGNTDRGRIRTGGDLYGALGLVDELELTKTEVGALSAAVNLLSTGCLRAGANATDVQRDEIVKRMRDYAPFAREYFALIKECEMQIHSGAMRSATLSIALLSFRFSRVRAESRGDPSVATFWERAIFDDGVPVGDPCKLTNRHLIGAKIVGGGSIGLVKSVVTPAFSCRYIINCFNAYMARRELSFSRVADAHAPLNMYGVSSDRTQWF